MAKLYIFLILIFITIIGLFAVENKESIILKIPFSSYYEMSKIALILISVSFGAFFIFIVFFIRDTVGLINKIQTQKRQKREEKIKEYYAKALNAIMRDKTSEAKEALQEILNEEPEHIDALIRLGDIAIKEEDFKTALKYYKKAYEFDPKNIIPLLSLEDMMEKMNDNELALKYIDQILSIEPDNLLAHYKMRNILEKMEKWEELINIQKKIIKMVSNSKKLEEENKLIGYSYEYGRVNLEQGNLENAERIFSTLIKSHPNFIPSYLGMVEVLISKGELEEAINLIEKAYFEHKSKILLIRLEDLLISIGDPKRLIQSYIKAINESPNDNELKMLLGRLYYRLEMIDDAMDILDSIDTAVYTNPKLYCIKGYLYLRRNQTLKALSSFKELCPENRISSINYSCKVCKSQFEEWTGRCSKCGDWNSFQVDFRGCELIK
ncbi:tetratricopeptide repeat protein [Thermodesulfovibrio sp. 1176]|uniref:tetratricopeptide repeat protein n=2 Tax=unclassified Thermodesulfovibrio TaxID=2645936 RepID=UPI0024830F0A|nr:tetratricopeptide repeat protein [Thermodesulfovibrio sp. 1176]MDI1471184.1 tetratricopeptide repeat protein [Thermodesulfovibrio sp. 1176]